MKFQFMEAWGGFYIHKDPILGEYRSFRLLLLTPTDCHMTLFQETWGTAPSFNEVKLATVLAQHVPIVPASLINMQDLQLVGHEILTRRDLEGYAVYLELHEYQPDEIEAIVESIIAISKESPVLNRFSVSKP